VLLQTAWGVPSLGRRSEKDVQRRRWLLGLIEPGPGAHNPRRRRRRRRRSVVDFALNPAVSVRVSISPLCGIARCPPRVRLGRLKQCRQVPSLTCMHPTSGEPCPPACLPAARRRRPVPPSNPHSFFPYFPLRSHDTRAKSGPSLVPRAIRATRDVAARAARTASPPESE
jgi:hypothetical protein